MLIDSYQFGKIIINGTEYNSDCIIFSDSVIPNWRRKQGHLLSPEDLQPVIDAKPTLLIVGCGASGFMEISDETRDLLLKNNIRLETANTAKAVEKFNEISQKNVKIAAALHLTC